MNGHERIVELLLDTGANIDVHMNVRKTNSLSSKIVFVIFL